MRVSRLEIVEPEVLARLGSAFDAAWEAVAHNYAQADIETQAAARADLAVKMLLSADRHVTAGDFSCRAYQFSVSPIDRLPGGSTPADTAVAEAVIGASAAANSR
jgi:hypothetical protein